MASRPSTSEAPDAPASPIAKHSPSDDHEMTSISVSPTRPQRPRRTTTTQSRRNTVISTDGGITGRIRKASISIFEANPQQGMWAATGTAIAHAPNLTELSTPALAERIAFNVQGHSTHVIEGLGDEEEEEGRDTRLTDAPQPSLARRTSTIMPIGELDTKEAEKVLQIARTNTYVLREDGEPTGEGESVNKNKKHSWGVTVKQGLKAFGAFVWTPTGFLITIYGLNIVAWGAMLFFLLLDAAPAMDYPDANADNSPRKIWLEIDSQILNSLFCVTAFGLAPWRFRDLYRLVRYTMNGSKPGLRKLAKQNAAWFRLPAGFDDGEDSQDATGMVLTASGKRAPATKMWKLYFTVGMMVLNTILQVVLCFFMWHYNRFDRPSWATGLFIGLGCGSGMFAGIMSWWEGRKVKKIEGPMLEVSQKEEGSTDGDAEV